MTRENQLAPFSIEQWSKRQKECGITGITLNQSQGFLFYHVMSGHTEGEAALSRCCSLSLYCGLHTNNKIDPSASCSTREVNTHFILFSAQLKNESKEAVRGLPHISEHLSSWKESKKALIWGTLLATWAAHESGLIQSLHLLWKRKKNHKKMLKHSLQAKWLSFNQHCLCCKFGGMFFVFFFFLPFGKNH